MLGGIVNAEDQFLEHRHPEKAVTNSDLSSDPQTITNNNERLAHRILIAEDHLDNLNLFGHILSEAGFDVVMVKNGEEACQEVTEAEKRGTQFAAVLMDMRMPVLDGYEATTQLREQYPKLPIIAVTAYAMIGDREKCMDAGCTDFLAKPFNQRELVSMVRSHTGGTEARGVV